MIIDAEGDTIEIKIADCAYVFIQINEGGMLASVKLSYEQLREHIAMCEAELPGLQNT